jgi:hypothetical protein
MLKVKTKKYAVSFLAEKLLAPQSTVLTVSVPTLSLI